MENTIEMWVCGIILVPQLSIMIVEWYCPPLWLRNHIGLWLWSHMSSTLFVEPYWFLYSKFNFDQINYNCGTICLPGVCLQYSTMIVEPYCFFNLSLWFVELYWFLNPSLWLWNHFGFSILHYDCGTILSSTMTVAPFCSPLWLWSSIMIWNHVVSVFPLWLWNHIGTQSSTMIAELYCLPLWLWNHFVLN